jgi:hypothetical protein
MATLDYANARVDREPWGPILFRPSRRSVTLPSIAALAATWLAFRHAPWQLASELDRPAFARFSPGGRLVAAGATDTRQLRLYDAANGRALHPLAPSGPDRCRGFVDHERRFLDLTAVRARLLDVDTGRLLTELPNPPAVRYRPLAIDPRSPRVITRDADDATDNNFDREVAPQRLWALTAADGVTPAAEPDRPDRLVPRPLPAAAFSPDGRRIVQWSGRDIFDERPAVVRLLDSDDLRTLAEDSFPNASEIQVRFTADGTVRVIAQRRRVVSRTLSSGIAVSVRTRAPADGRLARSAEYEVPMGFYGSLANVSADARLLLLTNGLLGCTAYDLPTGNEVGTTSGPIIGAERMPDRLYVDREPRARRMIPRAI